jgi:hypothetical protein
MGGSQTRYSVPIGEKKEGETQVYRHPNYVNGLNQTFKGIKDL